MKKERGQKNRLVQKFLQTVRRNAESGAGCPSHKGVFEPRVPEKLKNRGGTNR